MKNLLKLQSKVKKIWSWLSNPLLDLKEQLFIFRIVEKIFRVIQTRGLDQGVAYSKNLRHQFLKCILSMHQEDFVFKDKPKSRFLRKYINYIEKSQSYPHLRLVFTLLYVTRYFTKEPVPSFQTIKEGPTYSGIPRNIRIDIHQFLKETGINPKSYYRRPKSLDFKEFHMTSKSGPSGHALWTSFIDAHMLSPSQLESIKIVGGERLYNLIEKLKSLYAKIPHFFHGYLSRKGSKTTRKLVALRDKELKTREVAILDYYSQAALLPLHKYLYNQLYRIPQDCTHDQTKLLYELEALPGNKYHSIDLTAATDRFPIALQKEILTVLFGIEYANHWENLMVGTPFSYKEEQITYNTGNPMGAYSSFAVFAFSHHFLVFLASKRLGKKWKRTRYMMIGDDIVIADDHLAWEYQRILIEYGIPFNHEKTHVSDVGFEFAKQIRIHDVNVSPFPISALLTRTNSTINSLNIIMSEIRNKEWFHMDLEESLKLYLLRVKGWHEAKLRTAWPKIGLTLAFILFLQGDGNLGTALKAYVTSRSQRAKLLPDKAFSQLAVYASNQVLELAFQESRNRIVDKQNRKPLGLLAEQMVMAITSTRDGGADCFDLIESVPFLQIYGRAEEKWIKLQKHIFISFGLTISPREFRSHFEKVDIPLSDDGFYVRHRDILSTHAAKASRLLIKVLADKPKVFNPPDSALYDPQLGWYY